MITINTRSISANMIDHFPFGDISNVSPISYPVSTTILAPKEEYSVSVSIFSAHPQQTTIVGFFDGRIKPQQLLRCHGIHLDTIHL